MMIFIVSTKRLYNYEINNNAFSLRYKFSIGYIIVFRKMK